MKFEMLKTSSSSDCSSDESTVSRTVHYPQRDVRASMLGTTEIKKVFFLYRIFVLVVLALSIVGVAFTVYLYVSNSEERAFEEQFCEHAKKALDAIGISLDITLGAADAFVISMVSYARFSNSTWPFVTIPDFAVRSAKARSLSKAVFLSIHPVVLSDQRADWEAYSFRNDGWVEEGIEIQKRAKSYHGPIIEAGEVWGIHGTDEYDKDDHSMGTNRSGPYMPKWQSSPVIPRYPPYNWDMLSEFSTDTRIILNMYNKVHKVGITPAYMLPDPDDEEEVRIMEIEADWLRDYIKPGEEAMEPVSQILYPIIDNVESIDIFKDSPNLNHPHDNIFSYRPEDNDFVGFLALHIRWRDMLKDILPVGSQGIVVVFKNMCNPTFTYQINGPSVVYLGRGDKHNPKFDHLEISSGLWTLDSFYERERGYTGAPVEEAVCPFYLHVYPSDKLYDDHITSKPFVYSIGAICIFAFPFAVFIIYDCLVQRRQKKVMRKAVKTDRIVSSLFPVRVLDRMFQSDKNVVVSSKRSWQSKSNKLRNSLFLDNSNGKSYVEEIKSDTTLISSRPIADLYPETTVMFADIVHFTAWSSARQPSQVFTLLETLYFAFDEIAKNRGVFKVETIGDCYVAVAGLPEPRKDHAVVMAKFARDCRDKTYEITRALEKTLGPGTGDLQLRFGLNSGPVTAGVLRGEKSRFQLFGDTVNTAARMESLGQVCKIQVSQSTAELLEKSGKRNWLNPRDDLVQAKGKGTMQTFWVEPTRKISSLSNNTENDNSDAEFVDKSQRLIEWSIDVLGCLLTRIVEHRPIKDAGNSAHLKPPSSSSKSSLRRKSQSKYLPTSVSVGAPIIDEVIEIIDFPIYRESTREHKDPVSVKIEDAVFEQLCSLVNEIGTGYKDNPFHNFEHASQVALSTVKLISRINGPDYNETFLDESDSSAHHYGPLTQFAWVFAALVHDIDHSGLTNRQLIEEGAPIAQTYNGKSVAEQNSINVAWAIFMQSKYSKLRETLCPTKREMQHFRQLVINSIIATDIFDKDLTQNRNDRWKRAFQSDVNSPTESLHSMNYRKATLVVEVVIQASDVSHTMQHWHIYRKWNERLFEEMHMAYLQGCADESPSVSWYKNELSFFDFYIIPLAKKLKESGVLGVLSEELLDFAQKNRAEWETRGKGIVEEMLKKCQH